MKPNRKFLAALLVLGAVGIAQADDVVFIVNADNNAAVETKTIDDLYWGKSLYWRDSGKPVALCLRAPYSRLNQVFFRDFLKTVPTRFDRYWKSQMLSGRATAPKFLKDLDQMVDTVSRQAGAIGFITVAEADRVVNPRIRKVRLSPEK